MNLFLSLNLLGALNGVDVDVEMALQERSGCFSVTYEFSDSSVKESDYLESATEFIHFEKLGENHFSLQHVSIGQDPDDPNSASDSVAIHWREEWQKAPQTLWKYKGKRVWQKDDANANANQWVYRVLQIDGSPRTEYLGEWANIKGQKRFKSEALAPLPRRETLAGRPQDKIYDAISRFVSILNRENGYAELLLAKKLKIASDETTELVSEESGMTSFARLPMETCEKAQDLWKSQEAFWTDVRAAWSDVYQSKSQLKIKSPRDGNHLIQKFMAMGDAGKSSPETRDEIRKSIAEVIQ